MQQQDGGEDKMEATAINPGDPVHVLWHGFSTGPTAEIFYERDGIDFDPTTINLSNNVDSSFEPAIAVSGSNVHVVGMIMHQGTLISYIEEVLMEEPHLALPLI